MKELFRSKTMIGFMVLVLSMSYFSGVNAKKNENGIIRENDNNLVYVDTK